MSYIERDFKEAYKQMKERALDAEHCRDALADACRRALIDLNACIELFARHTLGEPHGLIQTIGIVEAALALTHAESETP